MPNRKTYDEAAIFDVKLTREVSFRGARLLPLPSHEMTGRALNTIIETEGVDAVDRVEPR